MSQVDGNWTISWLGTSDTTRHWTMLVGLPEAVVKECVHRGEIAMVESGF